MASGGDSGESTQPLSTSQIVEVKPAPPRRRGDVNDASLAWKGTVVGADEFGPATKKRAPRAKWIVAGVLVAGALVAGVYSIARGSGETAPAHDDARAMPIATPGDAAPAPVPPSAPASEAPAIDAGVAPADAAPAKKRGVKKKPAK